MYCTPWALTFASLAFGAVSIGALALAVSTDNWLITRETYTYPEIDNISGLYYIITCKTGLWRNCVKYNESHTYQCIALQYTINFDRKREENQPICMSIAEAQMGATPFFVMGLVLTMSSGIFSVVGNLRSNIKVIVAAVLSILQGLFLAVGIILYITFINDEASHGKPDSGPFNYRYSWSIGLVGLAFLASQSTAILCVTLYLKRNAKREDMVRIIPGLEDKLTDEEPVQGTTNYSTMIF